MSINESKQLVLSHLLPFLNIERYFPTLPGIGNSEAVAAILGISPDELTNGRLFFKEQATMAVKEALKDDVFRKTVKELPFKTGDVIVGFGDGSVDDLQGWFTMLEMALKEVSPDKKCAFINAGMDKNTTVDLLLRAERDVISENPTWVIVSAGLYDAQNVGYAGERTLISLADSWENVNALEYLLASKVKNPVIWVTPAPVIEELAHSAQTNEFRIFNYDLEAVRQIIAGKPGYIVDPHGTRFGSPADAWNYVADGIHASLAGHVLTLKMLVETVVKSVERPGKRLGEGIDLN